MSQFYQVCAELSLFILIGQKGKNRLFSFPAFCYQGFSKAAVIVFYHTVCNAQNFCFGAVIAFQTNHCRTLKFFLKIQDIFYFCATEFINGLVIITYHTDIAVIAFLYSA